MSVSSVNHKQFSDYDTIINLMNQSDFRELFDRQFNDFSEIKSVLLIMKTYSYLEKLYIRENGVRPSKEYMHSGIKKLIANQETRKFLVESTISFMNDEHKFEEIIEQNFDKLSPSLLPHPRQLTYQYIQGKDKDIV